MEFLTRFDYQIEYIKEITNKVADCLSRYYESNEEGKMHPYDEYVSADYRINPEGEPTLPSTQGSTIKLRVAKAAPSDPPLTELDPLIFEDESLQPLTRDFDTDVEFMECVRLGYFEDATFSKILANPAHFKIFKVFIKEIIHV
ncbi:uncharacterized protein PHACADRAFT_189814 [Phanerochaete carnosa HHB-10118-sp]|uniref:Uncharacterized protein n=1 Tax=Phanerochaete carnosa (strain HHB-10118-sp) TaxID=650164 RepID=K5XCH4_PHACS|nr:uncharacterized protein PHACADRAFT_189814 [Phanerochaete carnosa HHB-10118-sp]EKM60692.1 hypothetical protein PHACADRAFT_189814 [Phanerochaete carnosa HHB-10118-sp]